MVGTLAVFVVFATVIVALARKQSLELLQGATVSSNNRTQYVPGAVYVCDPVHEAVHAATPFWLGLQSSARFGSYAISVVDSGGRRFHP
ncbi:MAG: hypothetical protein AAB947_01380, partial [Patescibacteria group bacterium]